MDSPALSSELFKSGFFGGGVCDCDAGVFVEAARLLSTGCFTGPRVSVLMERLAIRLEAAAEVVGVSDRAVAESAYHAIVRELESRLDFVESSVRDEVAELAALFEVYHDRQRMPYAAAVKLDSRFGYTSVAGGALAVAAPKSGTKSVTPDAQQLVVTRGVYKAVLGLDVTAGPDPGFFVERTHGGVYVFARGDGATSGRPLEALPDGLYFLPGGKGALVTRRVVAALLNSVWVSARRAEERGFCYLRVVPPALRDAVAKALGPYPSVGDLADIAPAVYTWSPVAAKVHAVTDGVSGSVHYHVASVGTLPVLLEPDLLLGADSGRVPDHFDNVFRRFERSLSESRSASSMSPPSARAGVGGLHSRATSNASSSGFSGGNLDSMVARTATPVFHLQPGALRSTGPIWTESDNPLVKEWSDRMAFGPPIGHTALYELVKSKRDSLPSPAVADGGQLVAVTSAAVLGEKRAPWNPKFSPIPGWSIERMGAVSGSSVSAVPPAPGVLCRYEVSCDGPFQVNGLTMPGSRSAFWVDGSILITQLQRKAAIWRLWHESGAAALGVGYMALHVSYQYPAVLPARKCRSSILQAVYVGSDDARGESLYKASCPAVPGEGEVSLYISDSVSSEPVILSVSAPGLLQIMLHKVVVPAVGQVATCVTDLASLRVGYCVTSYRGRVSEGSMMFEVRRTKGMGLSRGKVVSQKLLPAPPGFV